MTNREDYVGDKNPTVFLYAMDNNLLPQDAWKEPIPSMDSIGDLSDNAFANPYSRTYPCHTKVACMLSAVWDASKGTEHPLVSANIRKHAAAQGIGTQVENIYRHFEEVEEKSAAAVPPAPERQYALQIVEPGNETSGYFDITYPHSVIQAADEATTAYRRGQLGDPLMSKVAGNIVKAATAFSIPMDELPQPVQVFGVQRLPDPYQAYVCINAFAKQAGVQNVVDYTDTMLALQEMVKEATTVEDAILAGQVAEEQLYRLNNANGIYPKSLEDTPHMFVFSGPTLDEFNKVASSTVPIGNVPVPADVIQALPERVIVTNFSKAAAATILQAKQLLDGAPSMEKSASASGLLESLTPEATSNLLRILSEM